MNDSLGKCILTVDIEDWYHLPPITGAPASRFRDVPSFFQNWKLRYDYLSEPTQRVLDLLREFNIVATFFIVADIVDHYPGLVEKIAAAGHEVACHGLHHACKIDPQTKEPLMSAGEFKARTLEARSILEKACGKKVVGYRAPNAYIAGWMVDILEEMGFQYDSSVSVNSIYNKSDCQLRRVNTIPYYPGRGSLDLGNQKRGIIEVPWPFYRLFIKFPTGGGPILRLLGSRYILLGLKDSIRRGNTLFYFHPIDLSRESFPLNSSFTQQLFWKVKGDAVEKKIRRIFSSLPFSGTTCSQMLGDMNITNEN